MIVSHRGVPKVGVKSDHTRTAIRTNLISLTEETSTMRRVLVGCAMACALLFAVAVSAAAPTNFAGTWALDKSKSKLPEMMANIESMTLTVTQDDKQITVENKISGAGGGGGQGSGGPGAGGPPGGQGGPGGGGGGGRGRGMGMGMPSATYKLDGSETTVDSPGGRPGSATLKAEWKDGGKALELSNVRKFNTPDGERTMTTKEHWMLSEDGKMLTIERSSESPRGSHKFTLVLQQAVSRTSEADTERAKFTRRVFRALRFRESRLR